MSHHPVHLCQPDSSKSCGACCGLYNWKDHSRQALQAILELQTGLLPRFLEKEQFDEYRRIRHDKIKNSKLFETIYNCEFLGFLDPARTRVGCMLHPATTGGRDLRVHCFYGAAICSGHFCPGYSCLTTAEQLAVVHALDDWYLYGLVITDIDLVKEFFRHVENTMGDSIREKSLSRPDVIKLLSSFFSLKEHWKFKAGGNRLGKYYFSLAEYNIARIDYEQRWGAPPSRFDKILVSLESDFQTKEDVQEAESIIQGFIDNFISVCEGT